MTREADDSAPNDREDGRRYSAGREDARGTRMSSGMWEEVEKPRERDGDRRRGGLTSVSRVNICYRAPSAWPARFASPVAIVLSQNPAHLGIGTASLVTSRY